MLLPTSNSKVHFLAIYSRQFKKKKIVRLLPSHSPGKRQTQWCWADLSFSEERTPGRGSGYVGPPSPFTVPGNQRTGQRTYPRRRPILSKTKTKSLLRRISKKTWNRRLFYFYINFKKKIRKFFQKNSEEKNKKKPPRT